LNAFQWQVRRLFEYFGAKGIAGVVLLLVATTFFITVIQPAQHYMYKLRNDLSNSRLKSDTSVPSNEEQELELFFDSFPESSELHEQIRTFQQIAIETGLSMQRVDYSFYKIPETPLWRYQCRFVLQTDYPRLRVYLAKLLQDLPNVAFEKIEMQRSSSIDSDIEVRLHLNFYYKHTK
jgi:hypothetical protein